ncbi:S8 family peptidase [Lentisalinibacter sediminis]|uniref:S8 family peptidase n=1 Tax=Lentisalinibacter sediminis TaxID=2992237 RepID=UPI003865F432
MRDSAIRLPPTADDELTPRSEGLMLAVDPGLSPAAATRAARRAVATALPGEWVVERLPRSGGVYQALRRRPSLQPLVRQVWEFARRLDTHPDVIWAEAAVIQPGHDPDPARVGRRGPSSGAGARPLPCSADSEWSLTNARLVEAFALIDGPPGGGIRVAHPDTGYTPHPEIRHPERLAVGLGYDFEADRRDPRDPLRRRNPGHGTATASVIMSAIGDDGGEEGGNEEADGIAVSGSAPAATLVPLRVSSGVVHFSFRRLALAIDHAIGIDADVISMSLGGPFASRSLEQMLDAAAAGGIISLAAAGNIWPWVVHPARSSRVIAVAASNCRDAVWRYSAAGGDVDLAAPGQDVWRALAAPGGRYSDARGSGTSYAVATVAGAAALWLSRHGRDRLRRRYPGAALPGVFRDILTGAGVRRPDGWDTGRHGAGLLDAVALLEAALPRRGPSAVRPEPAAGTDLNHWREFSRYFPDLDEASVRQALARLTEGGGEDPEPFLARFGDELRFHLATSPAFRAMLMRRGPRSARRPPAAVSAHLTRYASRELRATLQNM